MNRKQVEDVLLKAGVPASILGFRYIADAMLLLDDAEWKNCKWTALYAKIGKDNQTTASKVERAMRHAFERTRTVGDIEMVNRYIGFDNEENSNSLMTLYMRLKSEEEPKHEPKAAVTTVDEDLIRKIVRDELRKMVGMAG